MCFGSEGGRVRPLVEGFAVAAFVAAAVVVAEVTVEVVVVDAADGCIVGVVESIGNDRRHRENCWGCRNPSRSFGIPPNSFRQSSTLPWKHYLKHSPPVHYHNPDFQDDPKPTDRCILATVAERLPLLDLAMVEVVGAVVVVGTAGGVDGSERCSS